MYFAPDTTAQHNFANVVAGANRDKLVIGINWGALDYANLPFPSPWGN